MMKPWVRYIFLNIIVLMLGCKDGYKETIERNSTPIKSHTDNIFSITTGQKVRIGSRLTGKKANQNNKDSSSVSNLIEITTTNFNGSESSGESVSFLYDSSNFETINLRDNESLTVYYSSWAMFYSVQGKCPTYRLNISKMDSENWYVMGNAECQIEEYGKKRIRKIQFKGLFKQGKMGV